MTSLLIYLCISMSLVCRCRSAIFPSHFGICIIALAATDVVRASANALGICWTICECRSPTPITGQQMTHRVIPYHEPREEYRVIFLLFRAKSLLSYASKICLGRQNIYLREGWMLNIPFSETFVSFQGFFFIKVTYKWRTGCAPPRDTIHSRA